MVGDRGSGSGFAPYGEIFFSVVHRGNVKDGIHVTGSPFLHCVVNKVYTCLYCCYFTVLVGGVS